MISYQETMSVMVLLDLDLKKGNFEEFSQILGGSLPDTKAYDGGLFVKTCVYGDQNSIC